MKNIIFDFGNVIIDIDDNRVVDLFRQMMGDAVEPLIEELNRQDIFNKLEIGAISEESFIWAIQHAANLQIEAREIWKIWNEMLIGIPVHRLTFLENLRKRYRTFLLSNTNSIHLKAIYSHLQKDHQVHDFDTRFFEKAWYSHEVGIRKPDPAFFQFAMDDAGLKAGETLFIDDKEENVQAAEKAGLHAVLHDPFEDIVEVFEKYLSEKEK